MEEDEEEEEEEEAEDEEEEEAEEEEELKLLIHKSYRDGSNTNIGTLGHWDRPIPVRVGNGNSLSCKQTNKQTCSAIIWHKKKIVPPGGQNGNF